MYQATIVDRGCRLEGAGSKCVRTKLNERTSMCEIRIKGAKVIGSGVKRPGARERQREGPGPRDEIQEE